MTSSAAATKMMTSAAPWRERAEEALIPPLVAARRVICGDLLILSYGQSPARVPHAARRNVGQCLWMGRFCYKATTLAFTGLAVSSGCAPELFNIGRRASSRLGVCRGSNRLALPVAPAHSRPAVCMIPAGLRWSCRIGFQRNIRPGSGAHESSSRSCSTSCDGCSNWFIAGHLQCRRLFTLPDSRRRVAPAGRHNPLGSRLRRESRPDCRSAGRDAVWFYSFVRGRLRAARGRSPTPGRPSTDGSVSAASGCVRSRFPA